MLRIPSPKGEGFTDPQNATLNGVAAFGGFVAALCSLYVLVRQTEPSLSVPIVYWDKNIKALLISVVLGAALTLVWAEVSYSLLRRGHPEVVPTDRNLFIGVLVGVLERLLLTMLTIWLEPAVGAVASAVFVVKAVLSWAQSRTPMQALAGGAMLYPS
jgi:hypothetical protein